MPSTNSVLPAPLSPSSSFLICKCGWISDDSVGGLVLALCVFGAGSLVHPCIHRLAGLQASSGLQMCTTTLTTCETHISEEPVISLLAWQCRLQGQECLF